MAKPIEKLTGIADIMALCGSTVCAIHCLLLPVLLVSGIAFPSVFLEDETFHLVILWFVLPVALFALTMGCWQHKDRIVMLFGAVGIIGLCLSAIWLHDLIGEQGERIVTLIASACLIFAHFRNWRVCRANNCDHHSD